MRTIRTKYFGAKGRIKADDGDGNSTYVYQDGLNRADNHLKAAIALCKKMGWDGTLHGGHFKNEMFWVFEDEQLTRTIEKEPDPSTIAQRESEAALCDEIINNLE